MELKETKLLVASSRLTDTVVRANPANTNGIELNHGFSFNHHRQLRSEEDKQKSEGH